MLKAIYHRIRLLRLRSKEPYSVYYRILGFVPNDLSIFEQAFLHRSSSIKTEKGKWINNERLEFLGDAVLDAVVADVVFHKFETKKEGFLTNTRSKIVQRETLNKLALQLGLDKLVVSATHSSSHNNYMYGNAFEAFIGAIYVDQGYDACKKFIEERVIAPYIDLIKISRKEVNFKSKMIEWSQKNKIQIDFTLIESFTDGDNNPVFQTQLMVNGLPGGIGTGYSKKESQQNASKATLKKIQSDASFQSMIEDLKKQAKQQEADLNEAEKSKELASETETEVSAGVLLKDDAMDVVKSDPSTPIIVSAEPKETVAEIADLDSDNDSVDRSTTDDFMIEERPTEVLLVSDQSDRNDGTDAADDSSELDDTDMMEMKSDSADDLPDKEVLMKESLQEDKLKEDELLSEAKTSESDDNQK